MKGQPNLLWWRKSIEERKIISEKWLEKLKEYQWEYTDISWCADILWVINKYVYKLIKLWVIKPIMSPIYNKRYMIKLSDIEKMLNEWFSKKNVSK